MGTPRSNYGLLWDAYSVTSGFYWGQDDPLMANPCTDVPNDRLRTEGVNTGDLPHGSRVDCFRFAYYSPEILGVGGATTIALSGFGVLIGFYNNWSDAHDLLDPTSTPPTLAAAYLIMGLAANPAHSWEYSIDLLAAGPTWSFVLAGSDEDGDGADDWGWGIRWIQDQSTPRGKVGPLLSEAGPSGGSSAPGAENSFSRYEDAPLITPCGFIWGSGHLWRDFSMGLFSAEIPPCTSDCDADTVCDEDEDDCDGDGIPNDCEPDCNDNRVPDDCEWDRRDCNQNGILDLCEPPCAAADLAAPFGRLNIFDYMAFMNAYTSQQGCADLAYPSGVWNVQDYLEFQARFGGC